jgi:vacuolar-type H+-ATPase subunit H
VRAAQGLTTRISFPEPVKEIVCGDLYDPQSGRGSFVVQRSDNDVYLKPVVIKGASNLFIKTGEKGERVYNFDLLIVSMAQATRVINVTDGAAKKAQPSSRPRVENEADDILRNARRQAAQIVTDAEHRAAESDRQTAERADREVERRFVRALMSGLHEFKVNNTRVISKKFTVLLDQNVLTFGEKSYLRYTIQNTGSADLTLGAISLETTSGNTSKVIPADVVQNETAGTIKPGEAITGIVVFDTKQVSMKDKLTLRLRGEDDVEMARVSIVQ